MGFTSYASNIITDDSKIETERLTETEDYEEINERYGGLAFFSEDVLK